MCLGALSNYVANANGQKKVQKRNYEKKHDHKYSPSQTITRKGK